MNRSTAARWRIVCLASLGIFLGLGLAVYATGVLPGDVFLRRELLVSDAGLVHELARWVNYGGRAQVLVPGALLLFFLSAVARRHWWLWCSVLVGSSLIQHVVKFLVGRSRPSGSSLGFPSGHATAVTAEDCFPNAAMRSRVLRFQTRSSLSAPPLTTWVALVLNATART